MPEPHLRAADSDRAAVATTLGRAMAEGRLTVAEYDERLAAAYAARTFGELAGLTADLPRAPAAPVHRPSAPPSAVPARGPCSGQRHAQAWISWWSTALIVLSVWAATSLAAWEFQYFWPFWVIGPWGAVLLAGRLAGHGRPAHRERQPIA